MATMEVADSHMIENSTMTPSSHADIDMAGDYYDEEYTMHDAQPTAEVVDDEEIYDAEIEELAGHTEVEMDEYTDELADDNETNMGTYVLPDDATVTDITVESVHLPSSPIGTPRVELAHSPAAHTISPHVVPGPDLSINETAPADALSNHSPRSATTLVDDSEVIPLVNENEKVNPSLHEVTQLTSTDNQTHLATTDSAIDLSTNESAQTTSETEPELYEDELPTVTNSPVPNPSTTDQPPESEGHHGSSATSGEPVAEDPEPFEQRSAHLDDDESHSPIEDALVLNQQVRDDAADSMEPSPPVRLDYDDKVNNVLKSFNIFAPIDPTASEDVELLFGDNRTLFYEPLSVFFTVLRETDYFLHEEWQDAEMELTINLGRYQLSITEDNKQTDDVSLFKLFFIWSGLGLESPLSLTLQRHPGRFSIRYARLLNHLEQRDLQVEDDEHEDKHHGREVDEANQDEEQGSHTAEDNQQVSAEPHDVKNAYNLVHDARAHVEHEVSENAGLDAATTEHLKPEGNQQSIENMPENENEFPHNPDTKHTGKVDTLAEANIPVPPSPVNLDPENNDDLYDDEDYRYIDTGDLPTNDPEQRGEHHPLQDTNEQDEYIEATNLAPESEEPNGVVVEGSEGLDSYYEDYEAGEDSAEEATQGTTSAELEVVSSTSETALLQNSARHPSLKRNLEDLDDNSQQTAALSAPESLFDVKRAKRV